MLGTKVKASRFPLAIGLLLLLVNVVFIYVVNSQQQDQELRELDLQKREQNVQILMEEINAERERMKKENEQFDTRQRSLIERYEDQQEKLSELKKRDQSRETPIKPHTSEIPTISKAGITSLLDSMENPELIMKEASRWFLEELDRRQHPKDCTSAKYMYCPIFNNCGGGCVLHQTAYCYLTALANNRVVVVGDGWRYLKDCPKGSHWDCLFEKPTQCSIDGSGQTQFSDNNNDIKNAQVGLFSRSPNMKNDPNFHGYAATDGDHFKIPFWLPTEIKRYLKLFHKDPRVWVAGHIEHYLLRLNSETKARFESINKNLTAHWEHPVAGIHVRRTDKIIEAKYHDIEEYVKHVERWYRYYHPDKPIRIYLATDEPQVIQDAHRKYPSYHWMFYKNGDTVSGNQGANMEDRSKMESTYALLSDWFMLGKVDFLVGTASSQVTRVAYELLQVTHWDAPTRFVTLDDPWYFP